MCDSGFEGLAM